MQAQNKEGKVVSIIGVGVHVGSTDKPVQSVLFKGNDKFVSMVVDKFIEDFEITEPYINYEQIKQFEQLLDKMKDKVKGVVPSEFKERFDGMAVVEEKNEGNDGVQNTPSPDEKMSDEFKQDSQENLTTTSEGKDNQSGNFKQPESLNP